MKDNFKIKVAMSKFFMVTSMLALVSSPQMGLAESSTSASASAAEWKHPGGTPEGTRYSALGTDPLTQITPANVANLTHTAVSTGVGKGHQGQPIVVNISKTDAPIMRMFVVTPWPNYLRAMDMTGKILWTYAPNPSESAIGIACCDVVNRGPAYSKGKILFTALDGTAVAVDASTGQQIWRRSGIANLKAGETVTAAPIVVEDVTVGSKTTDLLIIGNAGAEMGVRGWVQALDINNAGATVWKYFNTGSDADVGLTQDSVIPNIESTLTPEELDRYKANSLTTQDLGCSTWGDNPTSATSAQCSGFNKWKQGGATVWAWITQDPSSKVIFYGTANPGVWNPSMRSGSNKWSSSIFARDAATGKVKWVNQLTPHDGWDFDSMNESILITDNSSITPVKQLVHFDKNGFVYKFDALTGKLVNATPYVNVTWPQKLGNGDIAYDVNGMPQADPSMIPVEGRMSPKVCPSPLGGKEFAPAAYSPNTGNFYVPAINFCVGHFTTKVDYIAGSPFMGDSLSFAPDFDSSTTPPTMKPLGELIAWNALSNNTSGDKVSGNKSWSIPEATPLWGGVLVTASNLAFYGTLDRHFKAIDVTKPLKENGSANYLLDVSLECGVVGNPITYLGDDGKQKVAVFTGVGWLPGMFAGGPCPAGNNEGEMISAQTKNAPSAGMVHIFSLP